QRGNQATLADHQQENGPRPARDLAFAGDTWLFRRARPRQTLSEQRLGYRTVTRQLEQRSAHRLEAAQNESSERRRGGARGRRDQSGIRANEDLLSSPRFRQTAAGFGREPSDRLREDRALRRPRARIGGDTGPVSARAPQGARQAPLLSRRWSAPERAAQAR